MRVYVNPSFRRRRIAGLLLTALKWLVSTRACYTLRLETGTRDPGGLAKAAVLILANRGL